MNRVLGRGAFASVWLGFDDELDISVAIKVLADSWAADHDVRERFLSEARLLRRIADPRVVRVFDVGTSASADGRALSYFVMDYVPGGTVSDRVGLLSPADALFHASECARAVQVLHEAGVIHRDVKPANFLVDDSAARPRIMVSDLGTAKAILDATGITMTMGTPAYMPPEQVFGEGGFDLRVDVYALGVVAYVLLTQQLPYLIDSVAAVTDPATFAEPPAPIAEVLGLPAELDEILRAAVSPDRDRRPASAGALADALDAIRAGIADSDQVGPSLAPSSAIPTPATPGSPTPSPASVRSTSVRPSSDLETRVRETQVRETRVRETRVRASDREMSLRASDRETSVRPDSIPTALFESRSPVSPIRAVIPVPAPAPVVVSPPAPAVLPRPAARPAVPKSGWPSPVVVVLAVVVGVLVLLGTWTLLP